MLFFLATKAKTNHITQVLLTFSSWRITKLRVHCSFPPKSDVTKFLSHLYFIPSNILIIILRNTMPFHEYKYHGRNVLGNQPIVRQLSGKDKWQLGSETLLIARFFLYQLRLNTNVYICFVSLRLKKRYVYFIEIGCLHPLCIILSQKRFRELEFSGMSCQFSFFFRDWMDYIPSYE